MDDTTTLPKLATHSGKFHLDDAFAYAALRLALGLTEAGRDHQLVRTRDKAAMAAADIVWDVGLVFDPAAKRFDHHQIGAPKRADEVPYSSAGMVWQVYGEAAVRAMLPAADAAFAAAIAAEIDADMVHRIDQLDNGVGDPGDGLGLSSLVGSFNLPWDAPGTSAAEDAAFCQASAMVEGLLRRRVDNERSRLAADALVMAAYAASPDKRILELELSMPWRKPVFAGNLPVLYGVYPVRNGNWMIDAMPPEPGSFAQRLPLPEAWAGLQDADLAAASGVPDAVFVHVKRFVGAAKSREGAVAMARKAIEIGGV